MHDLGRLEDLPQDYRDELTQLNLVPLWPSLRSSAVGRRRHASTR